MASDFKEQLTHLEDIIAALALYETYAQKNAYLDQVLQLHPAYVDNSRCLSLFKGLDSESIFVLKALFVIGQGEVFLQQLAAASDPRDLDIFIHELVSWEKFYRPIGGIIGYHLCFIQQLLDQQETSSDEVEIRYSHPPGYNLTDEELALSYALKGLEHLEHFAEMYPIGGAGDRLGLTDPDTGIPLPVARLVFNEATLLEILVRDVQAREYLYYKLYQKKLQTPLVLMTSVEKDNHNQIIRLCEEKDWFGHGKQNFFFIMQPQVPVVDEMGYWVFEKPLHLKTKPGGHGVLWHLAKEQQALRWLKTKKRNKVLIRQINNPIAGVDSGLLAFMGVGLDQEYVFGFSSCLRLVGAQEGVNVLKEKKKEGKFSYTITNVEYTEFAQHGIEDLPLASNTHYSEFPSNTNILFADIHRLEKYIERHPFPGLMINLKNKVKVGGVERRCGRLETMMQNIADYLEETFEEKPRSLKDKLKTYVCYNHRLKTISVTKNQYIPGKKMIETPHGAFYELMKNHYALFTEYLDSTLPPLSTPEEYYRRPSFKIHYHPALGPLYEVIAQKILRIKMAHYSELVLDLAEVYIQDLTIAGSVVLNADTPLGGASDHGIEYSQACGKCELINVNIANQGIDFSSKDTVWHQAPVRRECLRIILHGNAEFYAEDVSFTGDLFFEVPDQHRMEVVPQEKEEGFKVDLKKIAAPTWYWQYTIHNQRIRLQRITF